jgi:hypothetical protein
MLIAGLTGRLIRSFGRDEQGEVYLVNAGFEAGIGRLDCEQSVTVTVAPVGATTVPASGGTVRFDVSLTNTTGTPQTTEVWASADLSNGAEVTTLLGPVAATLPAGGSVTRRVRVRVPAGAPGGTSTLVLKAGLYPGTPMSGDLLTVTKQTTEGAATEAAASSATWRADGFVFEASESAARAASGAAVEVTPNPFAGTTRIAFTTDAPADVRLAVYDVLGREVAVLVDANIQAGSHSATFDARGLAAGTYIYRLTAGSDVQTGRLTLTQ